MTNGSLTKVESIAECSLQYFSPALSNNRSKNADLCLLFEWPLKTSFTVCPLNELAGYHEQDYIWSIQRRPSSHYADVKPYQMNSF